MGNKQLEATSQTEEVLLYLKKHGRITTMDAAKKLFIADLQGIIRDLRKRMLIGDEWVYKKNIYGRPIRYKRYFIEPEYAYLYLNGLNNFCKGETQWRMKKKMEIFPYS